jgi:hypothetical protein
LVTSTDRRGPPPHVGFDERPTVSQIHMWDVLHHSSVTSPSHGRSLCRSPQQCSQPSCPSVKWELGFDTGATIWFCFTTNSCQPLDSNGEPPLKPITLEQEWATAVWAASSLLGHHEWAMVALFPVSPHNIVFFFAKVPHNIVCFIIQPFLLVVVY